MAVLIVGSSFFIPHNSGSIWQHLKSLLVGSCGCDLLGSAHVASGAHEFGLHFGYDSSLLLLIATSDWEVNRSAWHSMEPSSIRSVRHCESRASGFGII